MPRDDNRVVVLKGVSSADGTTILPLKINPATGRVLATINQYIDTPTIQQSENAIRDDNRVTTMIGINADDDTEVLPVVSIDGNILINAV